MFHQKLVFRVAVTAFLAVVLVGFLLGFFQRREHLAGLKTDALAPLSLAVDALQGDIRRSIQKERYESLTETLSEIARSFQAHAFALVDAQGRVLVQEIETAGYQPNLEGLRPKLGEAYRRQKALLESVPTPSGAALRYLTPVEDADRGLLGGLEMELPPAPAGPGGFAWWTQFILIILAVAILVSGIVTIPVLFFVVRPINVMKTELEDLSKGQADLTFQMQVHTRDEVGETAHWFNSFMGQIRAMVMRVLVHSEHLTEQVKTMTHSTAEVSAMSEDVTTTVQQIAKGAEEQASKIAELNHLVQETQETMKEVEKKAHETAKVVDKATETARAGGQLARGTIGKMVKLNEAILQNSDMVGRLGTKSQQVGRAVEIITGIAEQTNLLSLNAAIEAARAGEQGRGFAVVAEEIRTLADGASRATQEITGLVQEMQDETKAVVESMEKSSKEAQVGQTSIRQMEFSLDEIISVIEGVVEHSRNIAELIAAQAQRYTKIVNGIQDINAVSEESAASTEEVSASTQEQSASMEQVSATCRELAGMAEELRSMVAKFKIQ